MKAAVKPAAKRYFTLAEVAKVFGVTAPTVWNWVKAKKIKARPFPHGKYRTWRVPASELKRVKARWDQGLPL